MHSSCLHEAVHLLFNVTTTVTEENEVFRGTVVLVTDQTPNYTKKCSWEFLSFIGVKNG